MTLKEFTTICLISIAGLIVVVFVGGLLQDKLNAYSKELTGLIAYCGYATMLGIGFILIIAKEYGL